jgi:hypothetical protein
MNEELRQSIIDTMQSLQNRIGETVVIEDWICTSGRSYDRHQTRYGKLILKIDEFSIRISGSIATMGNIDQNIEFRTDSIKQIEETEDELLIEINMIDTVWRRIKISKLKSISK